MNTFIFNIVSLMFNNFKLINRNVKVFIIIKISILSVLIMLVIGVPVYIDCYTYLY